MHFVFCETVSAQSTFLRQQEGAVIQCVIWFNYLTGTTGQLAFNLELGQGQFCHSAMHKIIFLPSLIDQLDVKPAQAFHNDGGTLRADIYWSASVSGEMADNKIWLKSDTVTWKATGVHRIPYMKLAGIASRVWLREAQQQIGV